MKNAAAALLLLVVPGCIFYVEGDDSPFVDQDAGVVFPTPDAWREPDAEQEPTTACSPSLPCPSASPNKVTVCGRLYDVETNAQIRAVTETTGICGDTATGGACDLEVRFYDAIDFAGNPTTAAPLAVEEFRLDDCGRFVARNINRPALGFLAIGVDDALGAADDHRLTGVAFPVTSQQVRAREKTYVIATATDDDWSNDVGFGSNTFVDRGVYMAIFMHGSNPAPGVTVTGANGASRPTDDYYFTDAAPFARSMVTENGPTGPNGAALLLNSSLVEHSGTGGEPTGCVWPSDLAASIPGTLFFSPRTAEVNPTTECP